MHYLSFCKVENLNALNNKFKFFLMIQVSYAEHLYRIVFINFLVILCPPLYELSHGKISSLAQSQYKVGDRVYFKCTRGYQLNQNRSYINCEETGLWNPGQPDCVGKLMVTVLCWSIECKIL